MQGSLLIMMTAVLWSTAGAIVKLLPWSAFAIGCFRGIFCMVMLMAVRGMREKKGIMGCLPRFSRVNVLIALCMFGMSTFYTVAIKLTTAANAIVLQYIAPVLVLLYTIIVKKQNPGWKSIALTGVAFGGIVLSFASQLSADGILGNVLALMSGVSLAGQILASRSGESDPLDGLIIGAGMSAVLLLPWLLAEPASAFTPQTLALGAFLGLFQYGAANLCYAKGIPLTSGVTASLLLTLEPVLTPVWAYLTTGEAPGALAIAGLIMVVFGAVMQTLLTAKTQKKA